MAVRFEMVPTVCEALGLGKGAAFVREFAADGETVAAVLECAATAEGRLADRVYYPKTGVLSRDFRLILNGNYLDAAGGGLAQPLKDGDRLVVVPGASG